MQHLQKSISVSVLEMKIGFQNCSSVSCDWHIQSKLPIRTQKAHDQLPRATNVCTCRDKAEQCINIRKHVCCGIFVFVCLWSSSIFRYILAPVRAWMHLFNMNSIKMDDYLDDSIVPLHYTRFCPPISMIWTQTCYCIRTHRSLLAAIQSTAQKCCWRMPQTIA